MDRGFLPTLSRAEEWAAAAARALRTGAWRPDADERAIACDVVRAVWRPTVSTPPYEGESLESRLGRLAAWAATIRLAMRAGGWELITSVTVEPAPVRVRRTVMAPPPSDDDALVCLPGLLTAVYRPVWEAESWQRVHGELGLHPNFIAPEKAPARMAELVPGLFDFLYAIEGLLSDVAETLTAVGSGETD